MHVYSRHWQSENGIKEGNIVLIWIDDDKANIHGQVDAEVSENLIGQPRRPR